MINPRRLRLAQLLFPSCPPLAQHIRYLARCVEFYFLLERTALLHHDHPHKGDGRQCQHAHKARRAGRSGGLVLRGGPIPGQKLVDALGRVGSEAREDVAEPSLGVDAVELGGLGQRVDGGGALATVIGAGEQPILAPRAMARIARSAALLSISTRPSLR